MFLAEVASNLGHEQNTCSRFEWCHIQKRRMSTTNLGTLPKQLKEHKKLSPLSTLSLSCLLAFLLFWQRKLAGLFDIHGRMSAPRMESWPQTGHMQCSSVRGLPATLHQENVVILAGAVLMHLNKTHLKKS